MQTKDVRFVSERPFTMKTPLFLGVVAFACIAAMGAGLAQQNFPPSPPPLPSPSPASDTYFGSTVNDPYRYMENMSDPTVVNFFKEQNAYTRSVLAALGTPRDQLFNRIAALDKTVPTVAALQIAGPYYYYLKQEPTANTAKLYVRRRSGGAERILVDPDKLAAATSGKHYTINYFTPSLDGSYVAYGISEGGSENAVIHVVSATGRALPDQIDRALFVGVTSWLPDGRSFYYVRFPQLKPGEPDTMKETRAVNYLHVLGRDPSKDPAVFGYNVNPSLHFDLTDFPIVQYSEATHRTYGVIVHGVKNEFDAYLATSRVTSPQATWKQIATTADDVTNITDAGSTIYFLTHKERIDLQSRCEHVCGARCRLRPRRNSGGQRSHRIARPGCRRPLRAVARRRVRTRSKVRSYSYGHAERQNRAGNIAVRRHRGGNANGSDRSRRRLLADVMDALVANLPR